MESLILMNKQIIKRVYKLYLIIKIMFWFLLGVVTGIYLDQKFTFPNIDKFLENRNNKPKTEFS